MPPLAAPLSTNFLTSRQSLSSLGSDSVCQLETQKGHKEIEAWKVLSGPSHQLSIGFKTTGNRMRRERTEAINAEKALCPGQITSNIIQWTTLVARRTREMLSTPFPVGKKHIAKHKRIPQCTLQNMRITIYQCIYVHVYTYIFIYLFIYIYIIYIYLFIYWLNPNCCNSKHETEHEKEHGGSEKKHQLEHEKCHGGSEKKHELEHEKCHGGSEKKHELEHEKCHGGSEKKSTN